MASRVIPKVDTWKCPEKDQIFNNAKGIVIAPIQQTLGITDNPGLDYFIMQPKKCYNSQVMRDHLCLYMNYFEKYYDPDHEYLLILARIKYMIDTTPLYDYNNLAHDIRTYIITDRLKAKTKAMVDDNYTLDLQYKNIPENLQYKDYHAKIMLQMSLFMNFVIPLVSHYANLHPVSQIDDFILFIFDDILHMYPDVDIFSKIYETANSNVNKNEVKNAPIWNKQDIRGKDTVTHSYDSVINIILNIMPKYNFAQSIISLDFTSITKNTSCQILDIEFEFNYIPLSSSKRDGEENTSDFDSIRVAYSRNVI